MNIHHFLTVSIIAFFCGEMFGANCFQEDGELKLPKNPLLKTELIIVDEEGNPVEGATVKASGMRTDQDAGSHYAWNSEQHGDPKELKSGADGVVTVEYPEFIYDELKTSEVTWLVKHPGFVQFNDDVRIGDSRGTVTLNKGFRVAATAINAETEEPVKDDLFAITGGYGGWDWDLKNGVLISRPSNSNLNSLRIMYLPADGPAMFSDLITVKRDEGRSRLFFRNVPLNKGVRVSGTIEEEVPRPIKNGFVVAQICSSADGVPNKYRTRWQWSDETKINEDGTFQFDSLPDGDVLQLIAVCDGWVTSPPTQELANSLFADFAREVPEPDTGTGRVTHPQLFRLEGEEVNPEIKMHEAAFLEVTVVGPDGPVADCDVMMWPNQIWFQGGSNILGNSWSTRTILQTLRSGEEVQYDRPDRFRVTTDANGMATIVGLPTNATESIAVDHDLYQLPGDGQWNESSVDLQAGKNEVTLELEAKKLDAGGESSLDEGDEDK